MFFIRKHAGRISHHEAFINTDKEPRGNHESFLSTQLDCLDLSRNLTELSRWKNANLYPAI